MVIIDEDTGTLSVPASLIGSASSPRVFDLRHRDRCATTPPPTTRGLSEKR